MSPSQTPNILAFLPDIKDSSGMSVMDCAATIELYILAQRVRGEHDKDDRWWLAGWLVTAITQAWMVSLKWLQVRRLEDKVEHLGREKEELSQALIAHKKGQSIAAGPGQTRVMNLMRRVHNLVNFSDSRASNTMCKVGMLSCPRHALLHQPPGGLGYVECVFSE